MQTDFLHSLVVAFGLVGSFSFLCGFRCRAELERHERQTTDRKLGKTLVRRLIRF